MRERPECGIKKCTNGAMIGYSGIFVCGDCAMKIEKKKHKQMMEIMENLDEA